MSKTCISDVVKVNKGEQVWENLYSYLLGEHEPSQERIKSQVIEVLKGLEKKDYKDFCRPANYHIRKDEQPKWERTLVNLDCLSDLPDLENILEEKNIKPTDIGTIASSATFGLAVTGFVSGAILAGTGAYELFENRAVSYIFSALGSVAASFALAVTSHIAFELIRNRFDRKYEEKKQDAEEIFIQRVEEYIQANS